MKHDKVCMKRLVSYDCDLKKEHLENIAVRSEVSAPLLLKVSEPARLATVTLVEALFDRCVLCKQILSTKLSESKHGVWLGSSSGQADSKTSLIVKYVQAHTESHRGHLQSQKSNSSGEAGDLGAKYGGNITDYELRFAEVSSFRRNVAHFQILSP